MPCTCLWVLIIPDFMKLTHPHNIRHKTKFSKAGKGPKKVTNPFELLLLPIKALLSFTMWDVGGWICKPFGGENRKPHLGHSCQDEMFNCPQKRSNYKNYTAVDVSGARSVGTMRFTLIYFRLLIGTLCGYPQVDFSISWLAFLSAQLTREPRTQCKWVAPTPTPTPSPAPPTHLIKSRN